MKIAAVTDDGKMISAHFGRAMNYAVVTVLDGKVVAREMRDKLGHRDFQSEGHEHNHHDHNHDHRGRGFGHHSEEKHRRMFATISDCEVVLARGMGRGAYRGLEQMGLCPVLTDIGDIETAVSAVIDGTIVDYSDRLH